MYASEAKKFKFLVHLGLINTEQSKIGQPNILVTLIEVEKTLVVANCFGLKIRKMVY